MLRIVRVMGGWWWRRWRRGRVTRSIRRPIRELNELFLGYTSLEGFEEGHDIVRSFPFNEVLPEVVGFCHSSKEIKELGQTVLGALHIPVVDGEVCGVAELVPDLSLEV